ncbi:reverse transcriptase domain-containing protein [Tanacetum coccineum]
MLGHRRSRDMTKYCHFYEDHGHDTNDYRELRHQIMEAVKSGQLSHLVKGKTKVPNTQRGDGKKEKNTAPIEAPILMISRGEPTKRRVLVEPMSECRGITFPPVVGNNNSSTPVIIKAKISGRQVNRVYMESGSSCEVIYEHCFLKLKPSIRSHRVDSKVSLVGFSGEHSWPIGEVPLEITIGDAPFTRTETLNFVILRSISPHNLNSNAEDGCPSDPNGRRRRRQNSLFCRRRNILLSKNAIWIKKNTRATYQRLVEKVFSDHIRRNLKAYIDDMVIKSTSEEDMLKDIQETFERFRSINMKLNPKKCSFNMEEGPFLGHLITRQGIIANPSKVKVVTDLVQPKTLKDILSLNGKLAALSRFLSKGAEKSIPFFKALKSCTDKKIIQWMKEAEEAFQKMKKFMEILPTLTALIKGEVLVMYLAASTKSISVVLLAKMQRKENSNLFCEQVLTRSSA